MNNIFRTSLSMPVDSGIVIALLEDLVGASNAEGAQSMLILKTTLVGGLIQNQIIGIQDGSARAEE